MYFLSIDTSTTSSKALLIDERGELVAVASSPHTLQTPCSLVDHHFKEPVIR
jgi:sugar (pentulose or hexulose) kinase